MSPPSSDITAALITCWWFAVGTVIGSFLNVVVYGLPAGMSIVRPGSHCPACKTPIRWYDTIPVLGWLVLAGRCRHCRGAISPRYPLVEGLAGLVFLAVAWADCYATNLAPAEAGFGPRVFAALRSPEALGLCVYHVALLSAILAAALIELDGHAIPVRLALLGLLAALAGLAVVPPVEGAVIAAAVVWYLLVRPSLAGRATLLLPPSALLALALLAWVLLRPFWGSLAG